MTQTTYREPAREISVCAEADVVVVGGGPGGHSAAIAAARNGARTVLLERYGHLGGMATGGILGMFVGATLLALGYQIFMGWVDTSPNVHPVVPASDPRATP